MFILASINLTMALSIDAAFPTFKVWRMRKYGDKLCALINKGKIDCPRGDMTRMKWRKDPRLTINQTMYELDDLAKDLGGFKHYKGVFMGSLHQRFVIRELVRLCSLCKHSV